MNMKTKVYSVQTPRGSATRYAWTTTRLIAVVEGVKHDPIVAATGRLLSWKSGNYSSKAKPIVGDFYSKWEGREISAVEAYRLCGYGRRGVKELRELARREIYNSD